MAIAFDGTGDYYAYGTKTPSLGYPITMCCWINSASTGVGMRAASFRISSTATQALDIGKNTSNQPLAGIFATTGSSAVGTTAMAANTWYHLTGVFTANDARRVYLNGIQEGTDTAARGLTTDTYNRPYAGTRFRTTADLEWNGRLQEFAIWDVELSNAEIEALAEGVSPKLIRPSDLYIYSPLIQSNIEIKQGGTVTTSGTPAVYTTSSPRRSG